MGLNFEALVALAAALPDDGPVHALVWGRLCSFSLQFDAAHTSTGRAQAIETIVSSLRRHPADAAVARWGCSALSDLMRGDVDLDQDPDLMGQTIAGVAGAAPTLLAVLEAFPASMHIVQSAICALDVLMELPDNIPRVAAAGGCAILTRVLCQHQDTATEPVALVAAAGGRAILTRALRQHQDPTTVKVGTRVLSRLTGQRVSTVLASLTSDDARTDVQLNMAQRRLRGRH